MTDSYLRRTVLAAAGAIGFGSATASAGDQTQTQTTTVTQTQTQTTTDEMFEETDLPNDEEVECSKCEPNQNQQSTIAVHNYSSAQCKVYVSTVEESFDLQVGEDEYVQETFVGSVRRVEAERGDLDIQIRQRNEHTIEH